MKVEYNIMQGLVFGTLLMHSKDSCELIPNFCEIPLCITHYKKGITAITVLSLYIKQSDYFLVPVNV